VSLRYIFTYEYNPGMPTKQHASYIDTVDENNSLWDRKFLGAFATEAEAAACLANAIHPDIEDFFNGSRSIMDREPTEDDLRAFIDLAQAYYGKSPVDLPRDVCDRLVREVLYGEQFLDEEQEDNRSMVDWSGLYWRDGAK
jgi:hypothetical protein